LTDIDAVRAAIDGYRATTTAPSSVPATN